MKLIVGLILSILGLSILPSMGGAKSPPLESLSKSFENWSTAYAQRNPPVAAEKVEALRGTSRIAALSYLRYLMEQESVLRRLRETKEDLKTQIGVKLLSSSEQRGILKLRKASLKERIKNLTSEPNDRKSYKAQVRHRKGFKTKAKRSFTAITKAQKKLDRLLDKERVDEKETEKLDQIVEAEQKKLNVFKVAYFGSEEGDRFEAPYSDLHGGEIDNLLKKVITVRDALLKHLRVALVAVEPASDGKKEGAIAGIVVRSENLGVLLDNSSSMTPFLQPLRDEVTKSFPEAHFRECYGCALTWKMGTLDKGERDQVLLYIEDLIIVQNVDALYWFSDLHDRVEPQALVRLAWLREQGRTSFYVLSVDKKPSKELAKLVTKFSKHKGK